MNDPEQPEASRISTSPHERLRSARERSGKTPQEVASLSGETVMNLYDLESYEDEIPTTISLGELDKLCKVLGISVRSLFEDDTQNQQQKLSSSDLVNRILQYLHEARVTLDAFEDKVGYTIRECFVTPEKVLEWNVDCLRYVCSEIGVDWLTALP